MRRPLPAVFGIVAVLVVAACTDSPQQQSPLAPTEPTLAQGDLCSGSLASQIGKEQKALFTGAQLDDLQAQFTAIKSTCQGPTTFSLLMTYIQTVINYRGTFSQARAEGLVNHWNSVALYATGEGLVRPYMVFHPHGGAGVLSPGESMTTFDKGVRLEIPLGSTPAGPHLYTFEPKPASFCGGTTTLRVTGPGNSSLRGAGADCYDAQDYPHETSYSPPSILTLCMNGGLGPTGIVHGRSGFGGEVLPELSFYYDCTDFHAAVDSWLGREAGPLGRVLARAYDYLRPQPLFAYDVGESGEIESWSPVGGVLTVVFDDNFDNEPIGAFPDGRDPTVGDTASSWDVNVQFPGYVQVQSAWDGLSGNVIVISQALGNCAQCPTVSLLGTRVNPSATDTIGTYDITWQSLQNKPSVKEAPFVVRSYSGAEIARLSYVTETGSNVLKYNGSTVTYNGAPLAWTKDVAQSFKITVNLHTLNGQDRFTTSLAIKIGNSYVTVVQPTAFTTASERTVTTIGYYMTGIDAGIIAADNILMTRASDIP